MRVVIIEDENIAIRKLRKMLLEIRTEIEFVAELTSVYDAKKWIKTTVLSDIDLMFCDIHLSDGLVFEIFDNTKFDLPIIFTTAFDEYALKAFKFNGIDYLLKPINKDELKNAIDKYENTKKMYSQNQLTDIQLLISQFQNVTSIYPTFISYQKDRLIPLSCENISYFYTKNHIVFAVCNDKEYVLEQTMDEIEKRLPIREFFRTNRQFIIHKKYISNAEVYFNNRFIVHLIVKSKEEIIVSREKATSFKLWLAGL